MDFNFDIKKTEVLKSLKIISFPLFKYSFVLSQIFFYSSFISIFLIAFSFLGFISISTAVRIFVFSVLGFILFLEIHLFKELKIKRPKIYTPLSAALLNKDNYNLAEFLNLGACQIIENSINICKKSKLSAISSQALFYSAILVSQDIRILLIRLGIDVLKLQSDLKNYLEKQERQKKFSLIFSDSFKKIIEAAAKISEQRGDEAIGEREILVALAKHDEFFKKILIDYDLKEKDVENITLWFDAFEKRIQDQKKFWTKENLSRLGTLGRDWASGFTVTLDQFAIDWRVIVSKQIFNEIIGHQKEIDDLERILTKSDLRNALIVGESGVGRKSIIQALAQRCYMNSSLPELNDKRVVELDMVALISRIQDQEQLEVTLDQIFQDALLAGNVILVIDQLDNFVTQKVQKPGEVDISVILTKYLAIPSFQFISITSYDGLHRKLEQSPAFLEYFRKIEVSEISELETIRILQNLSLALEQKHKILILYSSIREIVNLTLKYLPAIPFPKKAIDVLDESVSYIKSLGEKVLEPHHVTKIISDKTQIPIGKVEFQEKSVLLNLENLIHKRIINQDEAVSQVSIAMRRARAGIGSKKRPMGVFLFLGPTGVGKTETAKALAEIYFGGENRMVRLDMSEFQTTSDIARLIGAISPIEQQGLLTTAVRENPFSLVLLDEIEKAHSDILNLFLQVFDEGHVTDGQGRKVIFTNTIIICTSNAGAKLIFQEIESGKMVDKEKLLDYLLEKGTFKPEFINRFDAAVIFQPLTKENLMDIAQLILFSLAANLKEKNINFIITDSLKEKIVELSYKPEFGAREMKRVIQDKVENSIAQALLSDKVTKGDTIEINPENFKVISLKK